MPQKYWERESVCVCVYMCMSVISLYPSLFLSLPLPFLPLFLSSLTWNNSLLLPLLSLCCHHRHCYWHPTLRQHRIVNERAPARRDSPWGYTVKRVNDARCCQSSLDRMYLLAIDDKHTNERWLCFAWRIQEQTNIDGWKKETLLIYSDHRSRVSIGYQ